MATVQTDSGGTLIVSCRAKRRVVFPLHKSGVGSRGRNGERWLQRNCRKRCSRERAHILRRGSLYPDVWIHEARACLPAFPVCDPSYYRHIESGSVVHLPDLPLTNLLLSR